MEVLSLIKKFDRDPKSLSKEDWDRINSIPSEEFKEMLDAVKLQIPQEKSEVYFEDVNGMDLLSRNGVKEGNLIEDLFNRKLDKLKLSKSKSTVDVSSRFKLKFLNSLATKRIGN